MVRPSKLRYYIIYSQAKAAAQIAREQAVRENAQLLDDYLVERYRARRYRIFVDKERTQPLCSGMLLISLKSTGLCPLIVCTSS
ncbi:10726_t:CDS:2, partial [Funneliformis mosseae]